MTEDEGGWTPNLASKDLFPMVWRLAVAGGLIATLAVLAATFLRPPTKGAASPLTAKTAKMVEPIAAQAVMPKKVHTVTFRPDTPAAPSGSSTVGEAPPSVGPQGAGTPAASLPRAEALRSDGATLQPKNAAAVPDPLKVWAMFPAEASTVASANQQAEPVARDDAPKNTARAAKHHETARHHVRHTVRHARRHHRRRHTARSTKPVQTEAAQAAEPAAAASAAPVVKPNPIQAALNKIFGRHQ